MPLLSARVDLHLAGGSSLSATLAQQPLSDAESPFYRLSGKLAVDGLDLGVPEACVYGFLGPNGAGKTTLFNALSGIVTPDAGRLFLADEEIAFPKPFAIARQIADKTLTTDPLLLEDLLLRFCFATRESY